MQNVQEVTAAAAAAAVVREATAAAVVDVLEGESEEEKAAKLAAAKEEKMRKVIRWDPASLCQWNASMADFMMRMTTDRGWSAADCRGPLSPSVYS
jgi:hypothetical protein